MRDVAEPIASASDPRETLEPMLDDLARGLGYERALILRYDASSSSLRGIFGLAIRDEQARALAIPLVRADDPLVVALRTGAPQMVDDVSSDARLDTEERQALLAMRVTRFVAAALPGMGDERTSAVVVLARHRDARLARVGKQPVEIRVADRAVAREDDDGSGALVAQAGQRGRDEARHAHTEERLPLLRVQTLVRGDVVDHLRRAGAQSHDERVVRAHQGDRELAGLVILDRKAEDAAQR